MDRQEDEDYDCQEDEDIADECNEVMAFKSNLLKDLVETLCLSIAEELFEDEVSMEYVKVSEF